MGQEADGNNGGAPRLKLKSIQEMTLIDVDPAGSSQNARSRLTHFRSSRLGLGLRRAYAPLFWVFWGFMENIKTSYNVT